MQVMISAILCALLTTSPNEGRGVWCYPSQLPRETWEDSAKFLADNGMNMMFPLMLGGGSADYASDVLPRSRYFEEHGDQLEQCCAAAAEHGIEVHVWKVNFKLDGAPKSFVDKMRSEGRTQVNVRGKPFDWLCPSHPENRKLERDAMLEVARKYPVAGLHFDYIRYPGRKLCYCDGCRRRFEADSGRPVADWPDDCYSGSRKDEYNDWRCRQITMLVEEVSREARKIRPEIKISAAVFGAYPDCRQSRAQDWPKWIEEGYLDFVCPMNYTEKEKDFTHWTRNQVKLIGGRVPLYAGIGATSSQSKLSADEVFSQIELARSLGASGFVIFKFSDVTVKTIFPELAKKLDENPHKKAASLLGNANFASGVGSPDGWTLSGGKGRWANRDLLEVTGTGDDSNEWRCKYRFEPGKLYRFETRARGDRAVSGPAFANRDYQLSEDWRLYEHVFRVPDEVTEDVVRVGQWHGTGPTQFDYARLVPVLPVHTKIYPTRSGLAGGIIKHESPPVYGPIQIILGEGESIRDGVYTFQNDFIGEGSNYNRTLHGATARFNTNRWCFGGNHQVTYRFGLPGYPFESGHVQFSVCHHERGGCLAEISRDNQTWQRLATLDEVGSAMADVPADLLPADELYLRFRTLSPGSSFQINRVTFSGNLAGNPPEGFGNTEFAEIIDCDKDLSIENIFFDSSPPVTISGERCDLPDSYRQPSICLTVKQDKKQAVLPATLTWQIAKQVKAENDNNSLADDGKSTGCIEEELVPGTPGMLCATPEPNKPGRYDVKLTLDFAGQTVLTAVVPIEKHEYYREDYGRRIGHAGGPADVWWCESGWKIAPNRTLPKDVSEAVELSAARNDREAVQIVVRPTQDLHGLTAKAGALTGPSGATIPAENIKLSRVYYHNIHTLTDTTGARDRWPDALPPMDRPLNVSSGENQPIWVLVHVPKDAKPGDYSGKLTLKAEGWSAEVPLRLHVWNFTLPERNHLETAFGLYPHFINRYHRLETDADKRRVWELYLQDFAEHRISPYDPAPFDPIRVKFLPKANPPRAEVDFSAFDKEMTRVLKKYPFTNFRLPISGIGSGSCHGRAEANIEGFSDKTPEYQAMFSSYIKQLNSHLHEKGWDRMAYIYWFDEPRPVDYDFVRSGMERLKKYGPNLQTMLTEQPEKALLGPVDIWCPISYAYRRDAARPLEAEGNRFWWYVCCGPKNPYCTLFIDHPATELRTWLWQTWQRDIVGTLVWSSNYWTSREDVFQNPYEDPMTYVEETRRNEGRYWGNGDGRFIYPPLAAFDKTSGDGPVIAPPVSSIRWEMIREGIEDYEYLWMLRELIAKRRDSLPADVLKQYESLLEVPESITRDMMTFATDPSPIYKHRKSVAEAIEKLQ